MINTLNNNYKCRNMLNYYSYFELKIQQKVINVLILLLMHPCERFIIMYLNCFIIINIRFLLNL